MPACRNIAVSSRRHQPRVLGQNTTLDLLDRSLPTLPALGQHRIIDQQVKGLMSQIDFNLVSLLYQRQGATNLRFGRDMADHDTVGTAGEAAISQQGNTVAKSGTHQRCRR